MVFASVVLAIFAVELILFMGPTQAYSYLPYYVPSFSVPKTIVSVFVIILLTLCISKEMSPSSFCLWLLLVFVLVPMFVVYSCRNESTYFMLMSAASIAVASLISSYAAILSFSFEKRARLGSRLPELLVNGILIASSVFIVFMIFRHGFPGLGALNFDDTYEIRTSSSYSGFESSTLNLLGNYLLPLLIIYSAAKKNTKLVLLESAFLLMVFLWTANKTWLLILPLLCVFYYLVKKKTKLIIYLLLFLAFLLVMLIGSLFWNRANADAYSIGFDWCYSLGISRTFFLPGILKFEYFNFSEANSYVGLIDTYLEVIDPNATTSLYAIIPYPRQIAYYALGDYAMSYSWLDTGLFGNDYIHFGMLAFPLIVICLTAWLVVANSLKDSPAAMFVMLVSFFLAFLMREKSATSIVFSVSGILFLVVLFVLLEASRSDKEEICLAGMWGQHED